MTTLQKLEAAIRKLDVRAKDMVFDKQYDGYDELCDERDLLQETVMHIRKLEKELAHG